jgi:hypothetical protein
VIAEVTPDILRNRFPREERSEDDHDAYALCAWLQERDRFGLIDRYFQPALTAEEQERTRLEGWILGIV